MGNVSQLVIIQPLYSVGTANRGCRMCLTLSANCSMKIYIYNSVLLCMNYLNFLHR